MDIRDDILIVLGVGAAAVLALAYLKKKVDVAGGLTNAVAGAVGGTVEAVTVGTVLGIGDAFGVPRTEANACQQALRAGDMWTASFKCPAGTFLGGVWDGAAVALNPANEDNIINRNFTKLYQGITGSRGTLGTDIYDWTH